MSDTSPDTDGDGDTRQPYQLDYVVRIAVASALTAFVAGFAISDMIVMSELAKWLPRAGLTVTALVLIVWIAEIRVSRQLARNDAHLAARLDEVEAHLTERLGQIEEQIEARLREAAHAEGFVAGVQHRDFAAANGHLRSAH